MLSALTAPARGPSGDVPDQLETNIELGGGGQLWSRYFPKVLLLHSERPLVTNYSEAAATARGQQGSLARPGKLSVPAFVSSCLTPAL